MRHKHLTDPTAGGQLCDFNRVGGHFPNERAGFIIRQPVVPMDHEIGVFRQDFKVVAQSCIAGVGKGFPPMFNTPGAPDAYMTTLDGYPMTQRGEAAKALRVAHFSSASGDTFSDIVLTICARSWRYWWNPIWTCLRRHLARGLQ